DRVVLDDATAHQVLLNDSLEHGRVARAIPGAFRVDHRNRTPLADAEAVRLCPKDAARVGQAQFLQPPLQVFPGGQRPLAIAAFRRGLIAAEKNVPARVEHADGPGYFALS